MRFAGISKTRLQVSSFSDTRNAYNSEFNYVVDLLGHPQAVEVDTDWFYDPETNMFSPEGEIRYPEPEPTPVQPLTFEQMQALETANNIDYLVCLKDLGL